MRFICLFYKRHTIHKNCFINCYELCAYTELRYYCAWIGHHVYP